VSSDTVADLQQAYSALVRADPAFGELVERYGMQDPFDFPDGGRTSGSNFAGMILHIMAQQISTTVALILYDRLAVATGGPPTPDTILELSVDQLRALGASRSKATYVRSLAEAVRSGQLAIDDLGDVTPAEAVAALTRIRGIGPWSAEMFLIHQLHQPDVLPAGDLGIRIAIRNLYALDTVPTIEGVRRRGEAWAPYRTYASALLWRSLP
jgi:DNA-3-methyladenine glycosylase II